MRHLSRENHRGHLFGIKIGRIGIIISLGKFRSIHPFNRLFRRIKIIDLKLNVVAVRIDIIKRSFHTVIQRAIIFYASLLQPENGGDKLVHVAA